MLAIDRWSGRQYVQGALNLLRPVLACPAQGCVHRLFDGDRSELGSSGAEKLIIDVNQMLTHMVQADWSWRL